MSLFGPTISKPGGLAIRLRVKGLKHEGDSPVEYAASRAILGDKMNLTVRLGKLFYESSIGIPALLPCSQLPRITRRTLRKLFT